MKKPDLRAKEFAKHMIKGESMHQSMLKAGYSPSKAARGKAGISKIMLRALAAEGYKISDFAKQFTIEDIKNVAIGRLLQNAITGKDGGVMSAKTLGSHRDINLWTPEQMAGVIVISAPTQAIDNKAKLLDATD